MEITSIKEKLLSNEYDQVLIDLYEDKSLLEYQRKRYIKAIDKYIELYGEGNVEIYSVAGRSEVGGNHTDHQHGKVLAASINLDAIGIVSKDDRIRVVSDNYNIKDIDVNDLERKKNEEGTSESLIKGVVNKLKEIGYNVGGFKAYMTSDVLQGAGMSSSAAFEGLIGTIISGLYNDMTIDSVTIAKVGQYAENVYFGKPCGLMDQCACVVGGLITIDFNNPNAPIVKHIDVDFSNYNHSLCIIDTKGSHADLTNEYAAIPKEMNGIAKYFNKKVLRDVNEKDFYNSINELRSVLGDRAVLRGIHFFNENKRVDKLIEALNSNNFNEFKKVIEASGNSSYKYLQNIYASCDYQNQAMSLALALSENILKDKGVCRVHGGGFAGTIQSFVENDYVNTYKKEIEKVFGKNSCHVLKVRKKGGCKVI